MKLFGFFAVLITFFCLFALVSCGKKFNKEDWNSGFIDDKITYENRYEMVDDLMENYHLEGKTIYQAEQIMGKFDKADYRPNQQLIEIPILVKWSGIDPSEYRYLRLHYDKNNVIDSVYTIKQKP